MTPALVVVVTASLAVAAPASILKTFLFFLFLFFLLIFKVLPKTHFDFLAYTRTIKLKFFKTKNSRTLF